MRVGVAYAAWLFSSLFKMDFSIIVMLVEKENFGAVWMQSGFVYQ